MTTNTNSDIGGLDTSGKIVKMEVSVVVTFVIALTRRSLLLSDLLANSGSRLKPQYCYVNNSASYLNVIK